MSSAEFVTAVTNYLLDGNTVQQEMAKDVLYKLAKKRADISGATAMILGRLETAGFNRLLADFLVDHMDGSKEKEMGRLVIFLANTFDPKLIDIEASQNITNASSIREDQMWIWHTLSRKLDRHWNAIPADSHAVFFEKMSAAMERMLAYSMPGYFEFVLGKLDVLKLPLGFRKKEGDEFLKETFIPSLASWMKASRGRLVKVGESVIKYLGFLNLSDREYGIMIDTVYGRYFGDTNYAWLVNTTFDAFQRHNTPAFNEYVGSVLANDGYSDDFKDMLIDYLLKTSTSRTGTEHRINKNYDKKNMKISKWASITFECNRFNREGSECEDVAALCSTVFDIIMDVNIPIKYRTKMMTHAYALAVKFDPSFEGNPDFAALCRKLIAGPETKKVGEYYLKKWNDYHADLGREGAIE